MTTSIDSQSFYDLFDAIEEVAIPSPDSSDDLTSLSLINSNFLVQRKNENGLLGSLFKTMDRINHIESSDSLSGMSTSSSQPDLVNAPSLLKAVEALTLNNYGSNGSLSSLDGDASPQLTVDQISAIIPMSIRYFFSAWEEFLHNQPPPPGENDEQFPKFC